VLPSGATLLVYTGVLSLLLALAAGAGALNLAVLAALAASLLVVIIASAAIPLTAMLVEKDTVATFRRATALVFAGDVVWLFCLVCGLAASWLMGNSGRSIADALVFGAFVSAGLEFIIVNGVFVKSTWISLLLAALHPLLTAASFVLSGAVGSFSLFVVVPGAICAAILVLFPVTLRFSKKTGRDFDSVSLFRAFMKTWVGGKAADLERIIAGHAEEAEVSTKIMRFQREGGGDIFLVLPGVHPGPFYPIGSYNLPGLMFERFADSGPVMTLHRPGGHERNLATTSDTQKYVSEIYQRARSVRPAATPAEIRGPVVSKVGEATVSSALIAKDALLTISFAPLGSEDIETEAESLLASLGLPFGLDVSVVDAHNSIDPQERMVDTQNSAAWSDIFSRLKNARAEQLRVGYANSRELGLGGSRDITTAGIGLVLLESGGRKWALVLADSNNAVPPLREAAATALEAAGYELFEFCTTDSHDLAARGLTVRRGYHALGESTPVGDISNTVVRLAKMAESRLAACRYGSDTLAVKVSIFGAKSLEEFDSVTRSSVAFAKRYALFAVAATLVLLVSSLLL
jgi:putative membrane protein